MRIDLITPAIPFFFLLIGIELVVSRWMKKDYYRFNDSISDLSCGISQVVLVVFMRVALLAGYVFVFENFRMMSLPVDSVWLWIGALLLYDFCYYWFHRISHEVNIVWGSHVPHHQSEEYNLSVALRQGSFQGVFSAAFFWPLALAGVPPVIYVTVGEIDTLYQFWIHTRTIGRMGFLEWFLNTPSHHRVHHGKNPKYIDKNHGGILIIWDRLFGTFQREEEQVVYGTVKPYQSFNPLFANIEYWLDVMKLSMAAPRWRDKFLVWVKEPGWMPEGLGPQKPIPHVDARTYQRFDVKIPTVLNIYVLVMFVPMLAVTVYFLLNQSNPAWTGWEKGALAGLILLTLFSLGGILEGKRWSLVAEGLRLLFILMGSFMYLFRWDQRLGVTMVTVGLLIVLYRFRDRFPAADSQSRYSAA